MLSFNEIHECTTNENSCEEDVICESTPSKESNSTGSIPVSVSAHTSECTPRPRFSVGGCEEVVNGCMKVSACTENDSDCDCMQKAPQDIRMSYS